MKNASERVFEVEVTTLKNLVRPRVKAGLPTQMPKSFRRSLPEIAGHA
jgi:hypothetical protein